MSVKVRDIYLKLDMITIGITGGYATGKTIVANMLEKMGAKVVDADSIALSVMKPHTFVWQKAVSYFGKGILRKDGLINRRKLASIIFEDSKKRRKLNQLVHPSVITEIKRLIKVNAKRGGIRVLAVDVPLLFEAGIKGLFDTVIVVSSSAKVQYNRAKRRDKLPSTQILQRIQSQWPLAKKIKQADFVVDNSGNIAETRRQVKEIWNKMTNDKAQNPK